VRLGQRDSGRLFVVETLQQGGGTAYGS
jgi:hypothetical protein